MNIENHVTSLELSKKLDWQKETYFRWIEVPEGFRLADNTQWSDWATPSWEFICWAPTATEILEELPLGAMIEKLADGSWFVICDGLDEITRHGENEDNLLDALAKMYLHLKEKGVIE